MPWIRPLLLTVLLASPALPGHANEGHDACVDQVTGADSDADPIACVRTRRATDPMPAAAPAATPEALGLDCNPFALGGLASGAGTSGLHASQRVTATIRHCSLRGYLFGLAMQAPVAPTGSLRR